MSTEGYPGNSTWFEDHYSIAAQEIVDFLGGDGVSLKGKRVADIGTGDGIIALGLFHLAEPDLLVGYDVDPTDLDDLLRIAREHGIERIPDGLRYERSSPDQVPAATGAFDFVVSWSTFEHISEPLAMAREIRRLLAPGGLVMIQLFPFYLSEHGDHGWARPGFDHLTSGIDSPDVYRDRIQYLNRLTFDGLHEILREGGLRVAKVELIHHPFHVPASLTALRLSDLAIGGVKLLAAPI
ncbi:MAG: class I SAM-dependent methyltransferase [Acidimicrobiales bacterium]